MRFHLVRFLTLAVSAAMIALVGWVGAGTATAAPPGQAGKQNVVNVHGKGANGTVFDGQFTATGPVQAGPGGNQPLAVVGQLTGTLKTAGQGQQNAQQVDQQVTMPAAIQQATCQVLNLVLGPLHLNLLGLEVDLNQVVLNITANPQGGLLGSLLCSLAGQGGASAPLDTIIDLLGQILAALGGL